MVVTSNSSDTWPIDGHLPALDAWRALAILLVILSHAHRSVMLWLEGIGSPIDLTWAAPVGMLGVQVFFGLSGFLITIKLIEEQRKTGHVSIRRFYVRRFFRIMPAAMTFLAVLGTLARLGVVDVKPIRIWASLIFVANYATADRSWYAGHFWSLAVEEHFYIVWPALFAVLAAPRRQATALVLAIVIFSIWRAVDFRFDLTKASPGVFWGRTDIQVDGIAFGALAAILTATLSPIWIAKVVTRRTVGFALCLLIVSVIPLDWSWEVNFALISARACSIAFLVAASAIAPGQQLLGIAKARTVRYLAAVSFSLYLWQQLFLLEVQDVPNGLASLQIFPLNLLLAFALAQLSRSFIEQPCLRLGRQLLRSGRGYALAS